MMGEEAFFWGTILILLALFIGYFAVHEYNFSQVESVRCKATLLSRSYDPSRTYSGLAFVGGKVGMSTMSSDEEYSTVWQVEGYGCLSSTRKDVFRYSQDHSILLIKEYMGELRIWDIERYNEMEI